MLTAASGGTLAERTMLQGDLKFAIPIRSGTYDVTLTWIEPTADISDRRFQMDYDDRVRLETSFDVNRKAGGVNKIVRRTYEVTNGDGVLDLAPVARRHRSERPDPQLHRDRPLVTSPRFSMNTMRG